MALTKIDDRGITYPLDLIDNEKIRFGTGNDLEIYHDTANSRIVNGTAWLNHQSVIGYKWFNGDATETLIEANVDGTVELYYDGSKKLATTSNGTQLTGNLGIGIAPNANVELHVSHDGSATLPTFNAATKAVISGTANNSAYIALDILGGNSTGASIINFGDADDEDAGEIFYFHSDNSMSFRTNGSNDNKLRITSDGNVQIPNDTGKLQLGASQDLQIYHDGGNSFITNTGGNLYIRNNTAGTPIFYLQVGDSDENAIKATFNGAVELYYDNSKKLETGSYGFGTSANIRLLVDDGSVQFGADQDFKIYHDGNYNIIKGEGAHSTQFWTSNTARWRIQAGGHWMPEASHTYDIGTTSYGVRNVYLADSGKLQLGTSQDLQIYHNGSHSFIDNSTGVLHVCGDDVRIKGNGDSETLAKFVKNGAVELFYNDSLRLSTASGGVSFTNGHLSGGDNNYLILGTGNDLQIYHDGTHSYINDTGTGNLKIKSNKTAIQSTAGEDCIVANENGAVELYYDNSKVADTTSVGLKVYGTSGRLTANNGSTEGYIGFNGAGSFNIGGAALPTQIEAGGANYLTLTTNSAERLRITSDGKIGIGTSSPDRTLNINSVTGGNCDVELKAANNTGWCQLIFSDTDAAFRGGIGYEHQNNYMAFYTGAQNERLRITSAGLVRVPDNGKFTAGASDDLQIYHDGNHNYIDSSNGNVYIRSAGGENMAIFQPDSGVNLYFNNSKKFETTTDGIKLSGNGYADFPDNGRIRMGAGYDLAIYHDGSHSRIHDGGTGSLLISGSTVAMNNAAQSENIAKFIENGAVELYYDHSIKAKTISSGIQVFGNYVCSDDHKLLLGNNEDLQIWHDGSHSYIKDANASSALIIEATNDTFIKHGGENCARFNNDGSVELYYDNSKKLETTSTGATVSGSDITLTNTANAGDASLYMTAGEGGSCQIKFHADEGDNATDKFRILVPNSDGIAIQGYNGSSWENYLKGEGDKTELYYDNVKRFETSSNGFTLKHSSGDVQHYHNRHIAAVAGNYFFDLTSTSGFFIFRTSSSSSLDLEPFSISNGGRLYNNCVSAHTANLTLRKGHSNANGVDYFQCRNSTNALKMKVEGDGDVYNVNQTYGQISDSKLKENIVDANSQWDDIKAVKVRNFNFKASTGFDTHKQIGVVAQEIETVSPGLVKESIDRDPDTDADLGTKTKSVKYSILYMKAIKALQEAMAKIEVLETKVAALESA